MKEKLLGGEIVAVWWLDALGQSGPLDIAEAKKKGGLPMLTAGVFISEDAGAVRVAQDYYRLKEEGGGSEVRERVRDIEVIPKAYITKMRKWKV